MIYGNQHTNAYPVSSHTQSMISNSNYCLLIPRFAEAVSRREKAAVRAHIVEMAMYKVPLRQRGMQAVLFERSLCLVGQERATSLFRENFTSNTRHLITSNTKIVSFPFSHLPSLCSLIRLSYCTFSCIKLSPFNISKSFIDNCHLPVNSCSGLLR